MLPFTRNLFEPGRPELPSGVYSLRLEQGEIHESRSFVLLR